MPPIREEVIRRRNTWFAPLIVWSLVLSSLELKIETKMAISGDVYMTVHACYRYSATHAMETILLEAVWPIGSRPYLTRVLFLIFVNSATAGGSLKPCFFSIIVVNHLKFLLFSDGLPK